MNFLSLLFMLCLTSICQCQKANHGFFRSYKNNRSWGTGSQGQAITDVTAARIGQQQGGGNSLASTMDTSCSCTASKEHLVILLCLFIV